MYRYGGDVSVQQCIILSGCIVNITGMSGITSEWWLAMLSAVDMLN